MLGSEASIGLSKRQARPRDTAINYRVLGLARDVVDEE